jgi:hypothetical protein
MRPPKMTTRRMIITVAVVGLVLAGVIETRRRRERFLRIAEFHERHSPYSYIGFFEPHVTPLGQWREEMGQKHRRAAARPWLPLGPDPPSARSNTFPSPLQVGLLDGTRSSDRRYVSMEMQSLLLDEVESPGSA